MGKLGTKNLTQEEFDRIKLLTNSRVPTNVIKNITGRSHGIISLISQNETLDDVRRVQRARKTQSKAEQPVEPQQSADLVMANKILALQERQALALERLADAWERNPKRSMFKRGE